MGRSIPSITHRLAQRQSDWDAFGRALPKADRDAFEKISIAVRNRRGAIEALDEADIGIAMLLAAVVHLAVEIDALRSSDGNSTLASDGNIRA